MKKKIMAMCLVIAMAATAVIGGTLAYFTDTDEAVNVMVSGNVAIAQNEQQRVIDTEVDNDKQHQNIRVTGDNLEDFENGKLLVPAVIYNEDNEVIDYAEDSSAWLTPAESIPLTDNWAWDWYCPGNDDPDHIDYALSKNIKNYVDKIISVTNEGTLPVYARTIVLFEDNAKKEMYNNMGVQKTENTKVEWFDNLKVTVKDANNNEVEQTYFAAVYTYPAAIEAGMTSQPSLLGVYINPNHSSPIPVGANGEYEILALSQAVQTQGFGDATVALDTAFDDVTVTNIQKWFADSGLTVKAVPAN